MMSGNPNMISSLEEAPKLFEIPETEDSTEQVDKTKDSSEPVDKTEKVVQTIGVDAENLSEDQKSEILDRFSRGDWGDVSDEQKMSNDLIKPENSDGQAGKEYYLTGKYAFNDIDFVVIARVKDGEAITLDIVSEEYYREIKMGAL